MSRYLFEEMKSIYSTSGNYLHRMVPLKAVQLMCKTLSAKELKQEFQELLIKALDDKICNVRFTTCRVLKEVIPRLDSESKATFKSKLAKIAVCIYFKNFKTTYLFICFYYCLFIVVFRRVTRIKMLNFLHKMH